MKLKLFASIVFLTAIVSCAPIPSTTQTQISPTSTIINSTLTPTSKLQITYVQIKENKNFTDFYTIDITCRSLDNICFGSPKLLFRSLEASSSEQSKPKGWIADYSWSPDGKRIALISNRDILIGNTDTQEWTNITNTPNVDEYELKWTSDGKFIYYIACSRDYSGMCLPEFYRSDPTGQENLALLQSMSQYMNSFDLSPDGKEIVYSITESQGYYQLYRANLDDSKIRPITSGSINISTPSFSPDGLKVAFVRFNYLSNVNSRRQADIIVKDLISGSEKNLTENFNGEVSSPDFSPDGEWIVFYSFDTELNTNIFLVSLEQGDIVQVTQGNEEANPAWRWFSE